MLAKKLKKGFAWMMAASMMFGAVQLPSMEARAAETANLSDHLIGYWDFNQGAVTNKADSAKNGELQGTDVGVADSLDGKALHFGGAENSWMQVPKFVNTGTTSYSMSMWYCYDTALKPTNGKNVVLFQQSDTGRTLLYLTSGGQYGTYINGADKFSTGGGRLGKWQHIIFTYDAATKKVQYYVNGKQEPAQDAGEKSVDALTDLLLGRHKNGGVDPGNFAGDMDEIRIYDEVISPEKAEAVYNEKADIFAPPVPEEEAVLTMNPDHVTRVIENSVLGINHRYAFNGYGTYDQEARKVRDEFQQLYQESGFGSIRYPGGTISNLFQWKASLGPQEDRVKQIHGFYNNANQHGIAPNFGIGEIADFAQENDSEIIYVYGMGRGSAKDAADLVEYLNAKVGTNPNGGIDWAQVRADNGHPQPYDVRYFELGNEMNQGGGDGTASQQYWLPGTGDSLNAYVDGGTATFTNQYAVRKDDWNVTESYSKGQPNEVFYMRYANPKDEDAENFSAVKKGSVHVSVNDVEWPITENLAGEAADAQKVQIDWSTGGILFGDGVHGAIPAAGQQVKVTYSVEREGFIAISRAMRETLDKINEIEGTEREIYVYTSWEGSGFINKMHERDVDDLYDGMAIHPYSGGPAGGGASEAGKRTFYMDAMNKGNIKTEHTQSLTDQMRAIDPAKVPVISEYGIFRSTDTMVRSQTTALYIARQIMDYVDMGSPYIQKHCLVDWYSSGADSLGPTQQAVIQAVAQPGADTTLGTGDFRFFATPSASVFEMLRNSFGHQIIESSVNDGIATLENGVPVFKAFASKDDMDNIYVGIVNLDLDQEREITLDAGEVSLAGRKAYIQSLSGDTFYAENTLEHPDNVVIDKSETVIGEAQKLTLAPHSFTVVKIEGHSECTTFEEKITKEPTCTEEGEKVYTCSVCGAVRTEVIPRKPHTEVKDSAEAATCTAAGKTEGSHCSVCGQVIKAQDVVDMLGHSYVEEVTAKATPTTEGKLVKKCIIGGEIVSTASIASPKTVKLSKAKVTYTGKEQKPSVTVKDSKGQTIGKTNYKVSYKNNKKAGAASVTITFTGKYSGTLIASFTIAPKKPALNKVKAKKKGFTLSWKKDKTVTGYEVQYSLKKNFKGAKTEKINKSKITSKSVAKLKANKKYYVRIRSCVTVKVNGRTTKICSAWSVPKNVTPKK